MIGTKLQNRYRIESELGHGGVGTVYAATDEETGTQVAVKVLRRELYSSPELRERFEREGRALAKLSHPNIVRVRSAGFSDEVAFLVMEILAGQTLAERLKLGPLPVGQAVDYLDELLAALSFVHGEGLVHRDIKPANVFLSLERGKRGTVRLLDFGLAKFMVPEQGEKKVTQIGQIFGTPAYMAPEQVAGQAADARVDVYATGLLLYEMLTGKAAYSGDASDVLRKQVMDDLPDVREASPDVPAELAELLAKATQKSKNDRYENAAAMREALTPIRAKLPRFDEAATALELDPVDSVTVRTGELPAESGDVEPAAPLRKKRPSIVLWTAGLFSTTALVAAGVVVYLLATPGHDFQRQRLDEWLGPPGVAEDAGVPGGEIAGHSSGRAPEDRNWPPTRSTPPLTVPTTASAAVGAAAPVTPPGLAAGAPASAPSTLTAGTASDAGASAKLATPASASALPSSGAPEAPPAPAASSGAKGPEDPWATGVPAALSRALAKVNRGRYIEKQELKTVHEYNGRHTSDPRGHLVLARSHFNRRWAKDSANEYAAAYGMNPAVRGEPRMLKDLLGLIEMGSAEASRLVTEAYGKEALPVIDARLRKFRGSPLARSRLERFASDLAH